jgi:hypothetical protein
MEKLEALTTLIDNPDLIRRACFYVGWKLRSPNSWEYRDVFTGLEGIVTLEALIQATKEKREAIQNLKNPQGNNDRISADKSFTKTNRSNAKARKSTSRR